VTAGALSMGAGQGLAATGGESFPSALQAAKALVSAAESHDMSSVVRILGPSAKEIVTTSDPVADTRVREEFIRRAKEKMVVVPDPNQAGQRVLELGYDRWPFPIPLVQAEGKWRFDVDQGKREILSRRIGNSELTAIDVCRGYVEAQNDYFDRNPMGGPVRQYAQKIISSKGQRDGLYWPSANPDDESPIQELAARAIAEGYTNRAEPYHGYYFKILKGQGPHATGGAMDYMKDGAMTGGFALIAWPSDHNSTGVMTFIVDKAGIVYQKDLGVKTPEIARSTLTYDPDQTWTPVAGSGIPNARKISRASK
jgi:hypothetical protein